MAATAELVVLIKARDEASRAMGRVQGAARKMGAVMKVAAGAGVVALAGLGVASVKMAADFEAALSESLAIMGDVSDKLRGEMSDAAREVALTTTFSAREAAEAYFFLASAGLSAAQSIEALPKVAAFAQAGAFDMATATDLLTDAQSALGLVVDDTAKNMENMTRVSDVLVGANTLANASVQQFSEALTNKAGAALRAVNKDVEEGVAVLAVFADQGIKGSEAGTQLAIVLRDLQTKALQNEDAFAKAGVAVFDAQGNMNNMAAVIGDLEGALAGMSDAQAKATLLQLGFSDKSIASLQALLGNSAAIKDYETNLRSMAGITDEVAKKQLENFNAQLSLLKSQFEDVMITVGNKVLPVLTRFATWMRTDGVPRAKELASVLQDKLQPWIERLGRAFDMLRPKAETAGRVLMRILTFLNQHREILAATAIAIAVVLVPAFVAWAVAAGAAAIATIAAAAPIIAITLLIAALVLGIILLVKHWDEVTAFIVEKALWLRDMLVGALQAFGDFIQSNWPKILLAILAPWLVLLLVIIGNWDRIWDLIKRAASVGWGIVVTLFEKGKDALIAALVSALGWLRDHWKEALLVALTGPLGGALLLFLAFKDDIVGVLRTLASQALAFGQQIPSMIWEGIKLLKGWLLGKAKSFVGEIISVLNPANWRFSPENMVEIFAKQGRMAGEAMMQSMGSALRGTLPQVVASAQPTRVLSSRVRAGGVGGGVTVNVNISGPFMGDPFTARKLGREIKRELDALARGA